MKTKCSTTVIFRMLAGFLVTAASMATKAPTVQAQNVLYWYAYPISEGETFTGRRRVIIESSSTVTKWCIYLDGQPLEGQSYASNFPTWERLAPARIHYAQGVVSRVADNQSSSGCWTPPPEDRPYGLDIFLDTSVWTDGSHTLTFEAHTGTASPVTKTVNVVSKNTPPTVTWTSTSPIAIANSIRLTAKVTPQTHFITEACLRYDDTLIPKSDGTTFTVDTQYGDKSGGSILTFGSDGDGCFSFDLYKSGSARGLTRLTTFTIDLNTATWKTLPKTLTLTAKDMLNRVASASLEFDQTAKTPKLSLTDTPNAVIRETGKLQQSLEASNAPVTKVCAYLNDNAHAALEVNGCIEGTTATTFASDATFTVNTSSLANGAYTVKVTVFDRWGRSHSSSLAISVDNKQPQITITQPTDGQATSRWLDALIVTSIPSEMKTTTLSRLCVTTDQPVNCSTHSIPLSSNSTNQTSAHTINTACLKNGSHILNAHLLDSRQQLVQKSVTFDVRNTKPVVTKTSMKLNKPTWRQERTSGTLRFNDASGCTYKVEIRTLNGNRVFATSDAFTDDTPGSANIAVRGLPASTRLTATITSKNTVGTTQRTINFTTPAIPAAPPRPPSSGGGSSGGGGGGGYALNVVGWNLARVPSMFSQRQASSCWMYGYENGALGIWEESNWIVVDQSGYTVYVCKFR